MSSTVAGSSTSISGTRPGTLDPSQSNRLLRNPNSILFFAWFDPHTAHSEGQQYPEVASLSLEQNEYHRPRRIVIETTSDGTSFWRFVPRPRFQDGMAIQDEGTWPRVVSICGEQVLCDNDQWDIYKLDPEYDCLVQAPPDLSIISRINVKPTYVDDNASTATNSDNKRRKAPQHSPTTSPNKRARQWSGAFSSSDEDDMSVDEGPTKPKTRSRSASVGVGWSRHRRAQKIREENEANRRSRREGIRKMQEKRYGSYADDAMEDGWKSNHNTTDSASTTPKARFQPLPSDNTGKRKAFEQIIRRRPIIVEDVEEQDSEEALSTQPAKRIRTVSPPITVYPQRTTAASKRTERERWRQQRWGKIMESRKADREQQFMQDILEDVPEDADEESPDGHNGPSHPPPSETPPDPEIDEETARKAALAESIRKLQELEKDKPIWDEAAKARKQRETVEEDEMRAKAEERRREAAWQAELEQRKKADKIQADTRAQVKAEQSYVEAAAKAKRTQEKRQERQRWQTGPWTTARALDRYRTICESFDSTKFSQAKPLAFEDVPWPVLHRTFKMEDVDWATVEKFFEEVKPYVRGDEYKIFVEKSHRRFHPDRWRSRRLLTSIVTDSDREYIEVIANTVAQALTPLWRSLKEL